MKKTRKPRRKLKILPLEVVQDMTMKEIKDRFRTVGIDFDTMAKAPAGKDREWM